MSCAIVPRSIAREVSDATRGRLRYNNILTNYSGQNTVTVNERIEQQLSEFSILLYMKGTPDFPQCGFSAQVVNALKACRKRFAYVNILEEPELRQGLKDYSEWPTFPQLYVNGELLGGSDIVIQMYESGELQTLLEGVE